MSTKKPSRAKRYPVKLRKIPTWIDGNPLCALCGRPIMPARELGKYKHRRFDVFNNWAPLPRADHRAVPVR